MPLCIIGNGSESIKVILKMKNCSYIENGGPIRLDNIKCESLNNITKDSK